MIRLKIADHLIVPFGRPKWSIERIKIVGVSTDATFIESDTPLVYINKSENNALKLSNFCSVFPEKFPFFNNAEDSLSFIKRHLKETCNLDTDFERRFLDLYFSYCMNSITPAEWELEHYGINNLPFPFPKNDVNIVFQALMPLPQAHLYLLNPLDDNFFSFIPKNMVKVDFAFWTGKEIVAVEIDGSSHIGNESHVTKDRMLMRAGVKVIHILNSELSKYGEKVIEKLFPKTITDFWKDQEKEIAWNPLGASPF